MIRMVSVNWNFGLLFLGIWKQISERLFHLVYVIQSGQSHSYTSKLKKFKVKLRQWQILNDFVNDWTKWREWTDVSRDWMNFWYSASRCCLSRCSWSFLVLIFRYHKYQSRKNFLIKRLFLFVINCCNLSSMSRFLSLFLSAWVLSCGTAGLFKGTISLFYSKSDDGECDLWAFSKLLNEWRKTIYLLSLWCYVVDIWKWRHRLCRMTWNFCRFFKWWCYGPQRALCKINVISWNFKINSAVNKNVLVNFIEKKKTVNFISKSGRDLKFEGSCWGFCMSGIWWLFCCGFGSDGIVVFSEVFGTELRVKTSPDVLLSLIFSEVCEVDGSTTNFKTVKGFV